MREWVREIVHALEAGTPAELVAVTEASGSTPRGAGALMAVFPGGRALGTIGGGWLRSCWSGAAAPCGASGLSRGTPPAWAWSAAAM